MEIPAGKPNLAGNHRRVIDVTVTRNDLFRSVTSVTLRNQIPLGSKPRGGEGLSDDVYWATVPLEGLVYTVVHDPPGGGSYAELTTGSKLAINMELAGARSASVGTEPKASTIPGMSALEGGKEFGITLEPGFNAGWVAEGALQSPIELLRMYFEAKNRQQGPNFEVTSSRTSGWNVECTTDRVIQSSQDPALPGRHGDVILGGGIELVYKISDVLDIVSNTVTGNRPCLLSRAEITWLPRKPTSYLFAVASIELQVIPNLKYLLSVVKNGGIAADKSEMEYLKPCKKHACTKDEQVEAWTGYLSSKIGTWHRTLLWSSPPIYLTGKKGAYKKDYSELERVAKPFVGEDGIIEKHLANELATYTEELDTPTTSMVNDLADVWRNNVGLMPYMGLGPPPVFGQYLGVTAMKDPSSVIGRLKNFMEDTSRAMPGLDGDRKLKYSGKYIAFPKHAFQRIDGEQALPDMLKENEVYTWGETEQAQNDLSESLHSCNGRVCKDNELKNTHSKLIDKMKYNYALDANGDIDEPKYNLGEDSKIFSDDTERITASFTGSIGKTGMRLRGKKPPGGEEGTVLLSFSGGGHLAEYSFDSDEEIASDSYELGISLAGDASNEWKLQLYVVKQLAKQWHEEDTFSKKLSFDRAFMWNKRAHLTTKYVLSDPHYGDKFVVQVASDSRFGTPLFLTMGGRSSCPGELFTVFRESGFSMSLPTTTTTFNTELNPGERAIFQVTVNNESPYREPTLLGLRLIDGLASSLKEIVDAAYAQADISNDGDLVLKSILDTAALTTAKDSAEVKKVKNAAMKAAGNGADALTVAAVAAFATKPLVPTGTELKDSEFTINGKKIFPLGDILPLKFVDGDSLQVQQTVFQTSFTMAVNPGYQTTSMKYVQLSLVSLCEAEMASDGNLYRSPTSTEINLGAMSWSKLCPKVQFDESTTSKYQFSSVSRVSPDPVILVVNNPDRSGLWPGGSDATLVNDRLKLVRMQYRPISGGEWITAKDEKSPEKDKKKNILCGDSRTEGCKFAWNVNNQYEKLLSGFKDDVYELRVKNFCFGGSALAISAVHEYISDQRLTLTVDTAAPIPHRLSQTDDNIYVVRFYEAIDCSRQSVIVTRTNLKCHGKGSPIKQVISPEVVRSYNFKCFNKAKGEANWIVEFPYDASGEYEILVKGIQDMAGNKAKDFTIRSNVHCLGKGERAELGRGKRTEVMERTGLSILSTNSMCVFVIMFTFAISVSVFMRAKWLPVDSSTLRLNEHTPVQSIRAMMKPPPSYGATV
jgi:hypothetical protein